MQHQKSQVKFFLHVFFEDAPGKRGKPLLPDGTLSLSTPSSAFSEAMLAIASHASTLVPAVRFVPGGGLDVTLSLALPGPLDFLARPAQPSTTVDIIQREGKKAQQADVIEPQA